MNTPSGWELLQARNYKAAISRFKEEYAEHRALGFLTNIGITHLCMGSLKEAKKVFNKILQESDSLEDSGSYAYLGLVDWLSENYSGAIKVWVKGLDCEYTDEAGGLELPLLLFYAGVSNSNSYPVSESQRLLTEKLRSGWASNWPGPIGRFLVGKLDQKKLMELAIFDNEQEENLQMCQAHFYIGVDFLRKGNRKEFLNRMEKCSMATGCEVLYEPFLAKFELKKAL